MPTPLSSVWIGVPSGPTSVTARSFVGTLALTLTIIRAWPGGTTNGPEKVAHGYGLVVSNAPLNVITLEGNCARVPMNGIAQRKPKPAKDKRMARVVRAEIECDELVFMGFKER